MLIYLATSYLFMLGMMIAIFTNYQVDALRTIVIILMCLLAPIAAPFMLGVMIAK